MLSKQEIASKIMEINKINKDSFDMYYHEFCDLAIWIDQYTRECVREEIKNIFTEYPAMIIDTDAYNYNKFANRLWNIQRKLYTIIKQLEESK